MPVPLTNIFNYDIFLNSALLNKHYIQKYIARKSKEYCALTLIQLAATKSATRSGQEAGDRREGKRGESDSRGAHRAADGRRPVQSARRRVAAKNTQRVQIVENAEVQRRHILLFTLQRIR